MCRDEGNRIERMCSDSIAALTALQKKGSGEANYGLRNSCGDILHRE